MHNGVKYFLSEFFREIIKNIIKADSVILIIAIIIFLVLVCFKIFKAKKTYYCIKQHDITDCGPACIAIIAKQCGLKLPITKIRQIAGTDRRGTNAFGVLKAAEECGFSGKGVKAEREHLFSTDLPLPVIAHVIVDKKLQHYVVIQKVTKKYILIADPGKGLVKYSHDDFFSIWTGILLLLSPAEEFVKGDETQGLFKRFFHILLPGG